MASRRLRAPLAAALLLIGAGLAGEAAAQTPNCPQGLRKLNIGVSVSPPNVVHTSAYVAKALGLFAKHCVDANILQFEGTGSPAAMAAAAQGSALVAISNVGIAQGIQAKQVWGFAPRLPQVYVVASPEIKSAADLKGKRLSAAGGGVGGLQWRMSREVLGTAKLTVDDVQFVSQGTAGRLPGLIAGQLDAVVLHPEDAYLGLKQKPGAHVLLTLTDLLPNYMFNAYGAADSLVAKDRALVRDALAALIEANRAMYTDKEKVIPIIVQASEKPREAVEYAWDVLTKNCVWAVNEGFSPERTQWTIDYDVSTGDIPPEKKPTLDRIVDMKLATEAVEKAGGRVTFGNCKE